MGRLQLQQELLQVAPEVWYQKPPANRMSYPCFVYKAIEPQVIRADDKAYVLMPGYEVLYISREENDEIWEIMLNRFQYCSPGRKYVSDNLFHYPFTVYYK